MVANDAFDGEFDFDADEDEERAPTHNRPAPAADENEQDEDEDEEDEGGPAFRLAQELEAVDPEAPFEGTAEQRARLSALHAKLHGVEQRCEKMETVD